VSVILLMFDEKPQARKAGLSYSLAPQKD
jgi:hypothetical protein